MDWKAYRTGVEFALEALKGLLDETHQLDLKFLKMFFWGMEKLGEAGNNSHLDFILRSAWREFLHKLEMFQAEAEAEAGGGETADWVLMSSPLAFLVEKIEQLKPQVKESCTVFLGRKESASNWASSNKEFSFSTYANETVDFIRLILENLDGVLNSKKFVDDPGNPAAAAKQHQIGFVQGKLKLFGDFANLALVRSDLPPPKSENLSKLLLHIRTWANHISCLACLFWIHFDEMDESLASTLATLLAELMHKTMPYSPEITSLYLDVLKDANHQKLPLEKYHLALHAACYVDFLLDNLVEVESLREGLIFLLAFVMDPPKVDLEDSGMIQAQTDAIISEIPSLIWSIHSDETRKGIPFSGAQFLDFSEKIDRIKAQIKEAHVLIKSSLQSNSPRTNAMGFLDFLLRNLKKMLEVKPNFISSVRFRLEKLCEELASLRPLLQKILRLQDKDEKLKDLCMQVIDALYCAEYFINLSSIVDVSVWYITICLCNVIKDIKLLKIEVEKIEDGQIYNSEGVFVGFHEVENIEDGQIYNSEGVFVGFHEDARSIKDHLTRGSKDLTIISISGMAGRGKTTLARKIYNSSTIQHHFHKTVWCYVSQECQKRELLIRIRRDATGADEESFRKQEFKDLAEIVWKSLKGIRYLVVLDDIWSVDIWGEVQASFPDDKKGSRIMFTSRNQDLASQAKSGSISHPLRLFSDEESWELMEQTIFPSKGCPSKLSEIGKKIATYCKGLPLAVALIAALLGRRKEKELDFWKEVAGKLKSHLASEGCMQVMELSYQYLPDHLKACFLYFRAFPRGEYIRARKLKLLWIAEGFIRGDEMRLQDLAKECLDNLVSQSLVVVTERSSARWIKTCNVHDLLYDLCLEKAAQEHFLYLADKNVIWGRFFSGKNYGQYRICMDARDIPSMVGPVLIRTELPTSPVRSILCSGYASMDQRSSSVLESFKVVSVLDLEGMSLGCEGFPKAILSMVHLRYVAVYINFCKSIPPSISSLWNLETLIIKGAYHTINCPEAMLKMKSLRHIKVSSLGVRFSISSSELEETSNIETIDSLKIYDSSEFKETLRRLPKLKKLGYSLWENFHSSDEGWLSVFKSLKKLESLRIYNRSYALLGSRNLLPPADFLPENLKKLNLNGLEMDWDAMPTAGKLPNLEVLKLYSNAFVGTTWDVEDGVFLKLRYLSLFFMDVEEIKSSCSRDPRDFFPSLEEVVVTYCKKFEIPSCFEESYSLKTIKVIGSPKAALSAMEILKKQQENMGNNDLGVVIQEDYVSTSIYQPEKNNKKKTGGARKLFWRTN